MKSLVLFAVAAFLMGEAAMAKNDLAAKNAKDAKTGNISKARREKLIANVAAIKAFLEKSAGADTNAVRLLSFAAELEKEVRGKKYGLVFEEHRERVDVELTENIPVLKEEKKRFISRRGAETQSGRDALVASAAPLNFLIEGDNLAALKLLEKTHRGRIDLIYIDPPYNTGNKDFIYNDSYVDKTDTFRHSKWLSFMQKRLEIARRLMSDKGVIFISIDDNEQAALKLLCDDVFGEENFIAQLVIQRSTNGMGDKKGFARNHDYCLCYQKSAASQFYGLTPDDDYIKKFDKVDSHGRYKMDGILMKKGAGSRREDSPTLFFPLYYSPQTGEVCLEKKRGFKERYPIKANGSEGRWTWGREKIREESYRLYGSSNGTIYVKDYLTDDRRMKVKTILQNPAYLTDRATNELIDIFGKKLFDTPKPVTLLKTLLDVATDKNSIVLDFFAGSGTTGHAVMKLNAEDGGKRKFILVTNNENGICEKVTYERLKRVMEKEGYNAALKYFKIGYVPITEDGYWERADALLGYIRELVELENGIDFAHDKSVAIVLTDEELATFVKNVSATKNAKGAKESGVQILYKGHNVILGAKAKAAIERRGIEVRTIPDYYYPELED